MTKLWLSACASTLLLMVLVPVAAQQPAAPEKSPPPAKPTPVPAPSATTTLIPLRVRVVLSRYQGEKKLSNLPYDLSVNSGGNQTQLRIGGEVPVRASNLKPADDKTPVAFNFRTVGTSIDCTAAPPESGVFRLNLSVSDDSAGYVDDKSPEGLSGIPRFRTFRVSNTLLLRDGQTAQMTTATDPITGEVMRIDVTLNVLK